MSTSPDENLVTPTPAVIDTKKASSLRFMLLLLLGIAAVSYFAVPQLLYTVYLAEETANSKEVIVGRDTDRQPPPGWQSPMSIPGGGGGGPPSSPPAETDATEAAEGKTLDAGAGAATDSDA